MIKFIAEDQSLQDIQIGDIIAYVQKSGWSLRNYPNSRLILFEGSKDDKGKPLVLTLPANKDFLDSNKIIANAINLLAAIEHTSPQAIIQKIRSSNRDTIYIRILLPSETVPSLDAASHVINGLRNLVVYSACMEREPRRYFGRPFKEGQQQVEHFLFGHTFQGSFGFTVESPVEYPVVDLWGNSYRPIPRRVIERITRGLLFLKSAEQKQKSEEISQHFESGLNANMCNAIIEMLKDKENIKVEYSVHWSSQLEPSPDIADIDPILLGGEATYYLQEAARHMEEFDNTDAEGVSAVQGRIIELTSDSQSNGTVEISMEGIGKVRFSLGSEEYQKACNAHRDRRSVSAKGKLTKKRKKGSWILVGPSDFKVD